MQTYIEVWALYLPIYVCVCVCVYIYVYIFRCYSHPKSKSGVLCRESWIQDALHATGHIPLTILDLGSWIRAGFTCKSKNIKNPAHLGSKTLSRRPPDNLGSWIPGRFDVSIRLSLGPHVYVCTTTCLPSGMLLGRILNLVP